MVENLVRILHQNYGLHTTKCLKFISEGKVKVDNIRVPSYKKSLDYDTGKPRTVDAGTKRYRIPIRT